MLKENVFGEIKNKLGGQAQGLTLFKQSDDTFTASMIQANGNKVDIAVTIDKGGQSIQVGDKSFASVEELAQHFNTISQRCISELEKINKIELNNQKLKEDASQGTRAQLEGLVGQIKNKHLLKGFYCIDTTTNPQAPTLSVVTDDKGTIKTEAITVSERGFSVGGKLLIQNLQT